MNELLPYALLIPLAGFLINLAAPRKQERFIFWSALATVSLHALFFLAFTVNWLLAGRKDIHGEGLVFYQTADANFSLDYFFDGNTLGYFWVAVALTFLVLIFSRYYIHREPGFKRFFNNVLFFYLGLSFIVFAGNLETLFIGWEIIGITSFFLIAF